MEDLLGLPWETAASVVTVLGAIGGGAAVVARFVTKPKDKSRDGRLAVLRHMLSHGPVRRTFSSIRGRLRASEDETMALLVEVGAVETRIGPMSYWGLPERANEKRQRKAA